MSAEVISSIEAKMARAVESMEREFRTLLFFISAIWVYKFPKEGSNLFKDRTGEIV